MKTIKAPGIKYLKFTIFTSYLLLLTSNLITFVQAEVKLTPVIDVSLLGGKYFLDAEAASFQARGDAFISPVVKLSDSHELIPVFSGYYSGTQDVQELAGGGVLTRERRGMDFSLKYVYTRDFDKYKPRVSYSKALIRETKDETWGNGLFDYATFSLGFEAEQERPHGTFTESYDYYSVKYPNYSTLLSQSATVIDTTTFNELSQNAGADTMDNVNHRLAFGYTWFPEPLVLTAGYDFIYRSYGDQALVTQPAAGSAYFKSDKRTDLVQNAGFKITQNMKPLLLSARAHVAYLSSNQNSYDSSRTKYIPDYYDYFELGVAPAVTFGLKNGAQFGFSVAYKRLYYLGRFKQDISGNYSPDKIKQDTWLTSLSARYPLMSRFFARASYNYQLSSSNMRYEANYRYNYRANTYLFGVEWEF
ncbi:MAG: hypothetical protein HY796_06130 [Elusimicrobia bacterium]|nr:hypothetical protein [Elusimicrobiota bacterium]